MINSVSLTGRLTKDPELKYSQSGTAFANATLAVGRNYTNQQGERESDFIRLSATAGRKRQSPAPPGSAPARQTGCGQR